MNSELFCFSCISNTYELLCIKEDKEHGLLNSIDPQTLMKKIAKKTSLCLKNHCGRGNLHHQHASSRVQYYAEASKETLIVPSKDQHPLQDNQSIYPC
jgi:hypothetical protein